MRPPHCHEIHRPERHASRSDCRPALETPGGSCGGTLDDRTSNVNVRRSAVFAWVGGPQPSCRSERKNAATSSASSSGSSSAAKWPPRGISVQRRMSKNALGQRGAAGGASRAGTRRRPSAPRSARPAAATGSCRMRVVRPERRVDRAGDPVEHDVGQQLVLREPASTSPPWSLQVRNFSTIQAARPAGESVSA